MARIFTPSERTRRNINPQPVNINADSGQRSKSLVLLKNLVGSPIPLLWMLLIPSLFFGLNIHTWIAFSIAILTGSYICLDVFSQSREFRFFRLGIEIPAVLLLVCLCINNWLNSQSLFAGDFFLVASWIFLVYSFTYSLNLFPGLNRIFWIFIISGLAYSIFSFWQGLQYEHFFWGKSLESHPLFHYTGTSLLVSSHAWISALLCTFCVVFFLYKKKLVSLSFALICTLFFTSAFCLFKMGISLFYLSPFIPVVYFLFFISKHFARDSFLAIIVLLSSYWSFNSLPSTTQEALFPANGQEKELEKNYWRQEFENLEEHIWFGKKSASTNISVIPLRNALTKESSDENASSKELARDQLFELNSNLYLYLITQKGVFSFLFYMGCLLIMVLMNLRLIQDIPFTHHWHKVFALSLLSFQIFYAIGSMQVKFWSNNQLAILFAMIGACLFYMSESYLRQIVPDDHSL